MKFLLLTNILMIMTAVYMTRTCPLLPMSPETTAKFTFMDSEEELHEGTWLQWPHNCGWDCSHIQRYEESWIQMTEALHNKGERVHIIVNNQCQIRRVRNLFRNRGLDISQIDFWDYPIDDAWVRGNVSNFSVTRMTTSSSRNGSSTAGEARLTSGTRITLQSMPQGTLTCLVSTFSWLTSEDLSKSTANTPPRWPKEVLSIINQNRNPGLTQTDAEVFFEKYLGVTNFIWLDSRRASRTMVLQWNRSLCGCRNDCDSRVSSTPPSMTFSPMLATPTRASPTRSSTPPSLARSSSNSSYEGTTLTATLETKLLLLCQPSMTPQWPYGQGGLEHLDRCLSYPSCCWS